MQLNIATEFSTTPGPRYRRSGPASGEELREELLLPKFREALAQGVPLTVHLDGVHGYASSFLDEVFGGFARHYPTLDMATHLILVSREEPEWITEIAHYIKEGQQDGLEQPTGVAN